MTKTKIMSFRVNTDFYDEFNEFCTRNEISKKDVFMKTLELILEADKRKTEDLPSLNVPPKYKPLQNVSVDRREQTKYKNFSTNHNQNISTATGDLNEN